MRQLASLNEPSLETQYLLQVFAEMINAFKKEKYRLEASTFEGWTNLKNFLRTNASSLPSEVGAVKAKIDRQNYDQQALQKLSKFFETNVKCKVNTGSVRGICTVYQFIQSTFALLSTSNQSLSRSVSKVRDQSKSTTRNELGLSKSIGRKCLLQSSRDKSPVVASGVSEVGNFSVNLQPKPSAFERRSRQKIRHQTSLESTMTQQDPSPSIDLLPCAPILNLDDTCEMPQTPPIATACFETPKPSVYPLAYTEAGQQKTDNLEKNKRLMDHTKWSERRKASTGSIEQTEITKTPEIEKNIPVEVVYSIDNYYRIQHPR